MSQARLGATELIELGRAGAGGKGTFLASSHAGSFIDIVRYFGDLLDDSLTCLSDLAGASQGLMGQGAPDVKRKVSALLAEIPAAGGVAATALLAGDAILKHNLEVPGLVKVYLENVVVGLTDALVMRSDSAQVLREAEERIISTAPEQVRTDVHALVQ